MQVELCIKFVAGGYCDLNEPDAWKRTALHYAAEWGRRAPKNRQPTLLSGGDCPCCSAVAFDPQRVPHERSVALTIVNRTLRENGNQILVDFLIGSLQRSTAAAYSRDADRSLPRCCAHRAGAGSDVNASTSGYQVSVLHQASYGGHANIVRFPGQSLLRASPRAVTVPHI